MVDLPHVEVLGLIGLLGLVSFLSWTSAQLWFRQRALEQTLADLVAQLGAGAAEPDTMQPFWSEPASFSTEPFTNPEQPEMRSCASAGSTPSSWQAAEVASQLRQTPLEVLQQMLQATLDLRAPAWSAESAEESVSLYGWRRENNGTLQP